MTRPRHVDGNPVHVTMRAVSGAPSFRSQVVFAEIEREIRGGSRKGLRIVHYSVQRNHIHMIVEADDGVALWRGIQRFESRVAMAVNRVARRHGRVWRDRYHRHDLTTPRQVRNAYVYVLMNDRKHCVGTSVATFERLCSTLDPFSSARWFVDWSPTAPPPPAMLAPHAAGPPTVPARTWLATKGWKTRGLLRLDELPLTH